MIFLDFNIVQTLMLSIFLYLFGNFLTNKIYILYKLCIPPPVVGGLLFSLLVFILEYFKIAKCLHEYYFNALLYVIFLYYSRIKC